MKKWADLGVGFVSQHLAQLGGTREISLSRKHNRSGSPAGASRETGIDDNHRDTSTAYRGAIFVFEMK